MTVATVEVERVALNCTRASRFYTVHPSHTWLVQLIMSNISLYGWRLGLDMSDIMRKCDYTAGDGTCNEHTVWTAETSHLCPFNGQRWLASVVYIFLSRKVVERWNFINGWWEDLSLRRRQDCWSDGELYCQVYIGWWPIYECLRWDPVRSKGFSYAAVSLSLCWMWKGRYLGREVFSVACNFIRETGSESQIRFPIFRWSRKGLWGLCEYWGSKDYHISSRAIRSVGGSSRYSSTSSLCITLPVILLLRLQPVEQVWKSGPHRWSDIQQERQIDADSRALILSSDFSISYGNNRQSNIRSPVLEFLSCGRLGRENQYGTSTLH